MESAAQPQSFSSIISAAFPVVLPLPRRSGAIRHVTACETRKTRKPRSFAPIISSRVRNIGAASSHLCDGPFLPAWTTRMLEKRSSREITGNRETRDFPCLARVCARIRGSSMSLRERERGSPSPISFLTPLTRDALAEKASIRGMLFRNFLDGEIRCSRSGASNVFPFQRGLDVFAR